MTNEIILQKLQEIRGDRTYKEMAEELDIHEITLWRIMNGERGIGPEVLEKLLRVYSDQIIPLFLPENKSVV